MQLQGIVEKKRVAIGSKSERDAVMLNGYNLRMVGGNAMRDPILDAFVGKRIAAEGNFHGTTFIITGVRILP